MDNKFDRIEEECIKELENTFDIKLPNEYRYFLMNHDKMIPKKGIINLLYFDKNKDLPEKSTQLVVFTNLDNLSMAIKDEYLKEKNMIPIAFTYGDNMICIGIDTNNYGKIYYWNMDFDFIYLANSIDEFLNLIE